jgi:hypothetical protein
MVLLAVLVAVAARLQRVHLRVEELLVKVLLVVLDLMVYLHLRLAAAAVARVQLEEIHQLTQLLLQRLATAVLVKCLAYLAVGFFMLEVVVLVQIMAEVAVLL